MDQWHIHMCAWKAWFPTVDHLFEIHRVTLMCMGGTAVIYYVNEWMMMSTSSHNHDRGVENSAPWHFDLTPFSLTMGTPLWLAGSLAVKIHLLVDLDNRLCCCDDRCVVCRNHDIVMCGTRWCVITQLPLLLCTIDHSTFTWVVILVQDCHVRPQDFKDIKFPLSRAAARSWMLDYECFYLESCSHGQTLVKYRKL